MTNLSDSPVCTQRTVVNLAQVRAEKIEAAEDRADGGMSRMMRDVVRGIRADRAERDAAQAAWEIEQERLLVELIRREIKAALAADKRKSARAAKRKAVTP